MGLKIPLGFNETLWSQEAPLAVGGENAREKGWGSLKIWGSAYENLLLYFLSNANVGPFPALRDCRSKRGRGSLNTMSKKTLE